MKGKILIVVIVAIVVISIAVYFIYKGSKPVSKYKGEYKVVNGKIISLSSDPVIQKIIDAYELPKNTEWIQSLKEEAISKGMIVEDKLWETALWLRANDDYWKTQTA